MEDLSREAQRLLHKFNTGSELTLDMIASQAGDCSVRHARRLLAELRASGNHVIECRKHRSKVFSIPENERKHAVRPVSLMEEEILAVTVASQAARSVLMPTPLAAHLERAFTKLHGSLRTTPIAIDLDEESRQWHFGEAPSVPIGEGIWTSLRSSIEDMRSVRIDYFSAGTERRSEGRTVDPYCLAVRNGSWLLVAWCHERRDFREFSLPDISRVDPLDPETDVRAFFDRREDFDAAEHFRGRFHAVGGEPATVRLLVEPHQARYFSRKTYHPSQIIETSHEDGRVVVRYDVLGLDEIRSFIQSWGVGVTVLEPPALVAAIRRQSEILAQRYAQAEGQTDE